MVRILLAALLPLLAVFVAGPLRYYTHWPVVLCLVLALPPVMAAVWALRRGPTLRADASVRLFFVALALVLAGLMLRWLYNPALDGLAGSDAAATVTAMHARAGVRFGALQPDVANGQVALYALMATAHLFGITPFASLRFAFYVVVVVLAMAMAGSAAIGAASLQSRRAMTLYAAVYLVLAVVALRWEILPLLHTWQANGDFPQLLSMVPMAILWLLFALVEPPLARALIGLLGLALLRFTYAINVGDLALALAMLFFADALAATPAQRRRLLLVSGGWLVIGAMALRQLFLARTIAKPHPAIDQFWMQLVLLMIALALTAIPELVARSSVAFSPTMQRLVALARNLSLASWLAIYIYVLAYLARPQDLPLALIYNTYLLVPLLVALTALLPSVAFLATALVETAMQRNPLAAVGAPVTLAFAALLLWSLTAAFPAALVETRERAYGRPPFGHLVALDDREADRFIGQILRSRHKAMGGLIASGTSAMFLVAAWDAPSELPSPLSADRCYFWSPAVGDTAPAIAELRTRDQPVCRRYHPRSAPATTGEICAICL